VREIFAATSGSFVRPFNLPENITSEALLFLGEEDAV